MMTSDWYTPTGVGAGGSWRLSSFNRVSALRAAHRFEVREDLLPLFTARIPGLLDLRVFAAMMHESFDFKPCLRRWFSHLDSSEFGADCQQSRAFLRKDRILHFVRQGRDGRQGLHQN